MNRIHISKTERKEIEIAIQQHHNEPLSAFVNGSEAIRLYRPSMTPTSIVVTVQELKALLEELAIKEIHEKPARS